MEFLRQDPKPAVQVMFRTSELISNRLCNGLYALVKNGMPVEIAFSHPRDYLKIEKITSAAC